MAADTAPKCRMCEKHPMLPIPRLDGTDSSFLACANCDSPTGVMPKMGKPT